MEPLVEEESVFGRGPRLLVAVVWGEASTLYLLHREEPVAHSAV